MKIALSWLNDYTDIKDISPKDFAHGMTMTGTMVEGFQEMGEGINKVVTGKITQIEKHPNADKLQVCQVDIGGSSIQVITAATNVFVGAVVPVALDGSDLPGGIKIKKRQMRGLDTEGMFCSVNELNLDPEPATGIMILDDSIPAGIDIKTALDLNDTIVEFEITSNRCDCLSVIGLAREAAVTFGKPFSVKDPAPKGSGDDVNKYATVEVKDPVLCPRYSARAVKNVKIGPSPKWLADRLNASGVRSINNIVDITNYIMLEYGQPMHAFDLSHVAGSSIIVRRAQNGEAMKTLDGQDRILSEEMLVIADAQRAVAVAGVMGAENSEIEDTTTTILFESANFDAASVRRTAKKLGLRTEASARYEKGLNPEITIDAVNRACQLVEQLGCGEVIDGIIDVKGNISDQVVVDFKPDRINALLGTDLTEEYIIEILEKLEFTIKDGKVYVPSFRNDIEGTADLAEEVARIYGYNEIPDTLLSGETTHGGRNEVQQLEVIIRQSLIAQGLDEITTYSFVDPHEYDKLLMERPQTVTIRNPLGEERSIMRTNTIGSMLDTLSVNYNHRNSSAWLFEIGKVYLPVDSEPLPHEKKMLTIGMYGDCDFYDLKGVVENMFEAMGITSYDIEPLADNPTFHPGQTAQISLRRRAAAIVGRIHPVVQENYGIDTEAYVAVIDFDMLMECKKLARKYKPLPKFPATSRDIAVIVADDVPVRKIENIINKAKTDIIEGYKLFDVYKGKQVKEGFKSVAYSISFRASDRTLTDAEVNEVMDNIINELKKQLRAELRD